MFGESLDVSSIATGVISSFVAAVVFLVFLRGIRPRLFICDCIARSEIQGDGRGTHSIKVINNSFFSLIDVELRLDRIHLHTTMPNAQPLMTAAQIPLKTDRLFSIPRYSPWDKSAEYAHRFAISGDLQEQWPQEANSYLLFRIAGTHSLSGFRKVFTKKFMHQNIRNGTFHFGNACEVSE